MRSANLISVAVVLSALAQISLPAFASDISFRETKRVSFTIVSAGAPWDEQGRPRHHLLAVVVYLTGLPPARE